MPRGFFTSILYTKRFNFALFFKTGVLNSHKFSTFEAFWQKKIKPINRGVE